MLIIYDFHKIIYLLSWDQALMMVMMIKLCIYVTNWNGSFISSIKSFLAVASLHDFFSLYHHTNFNSNKDFCFLETLILMATSFLFSFYIFMLHFYGRWGGPLPESWFDQQLLLQKKILSRMYDFGMAPGTYFHLGYSLCWILSILVIHAFENSSYAINDIIWWDVIWVVCSAGKRPQGPPGRQYPRFQTRYEWRGIIQ